MSSFLSASAGKGPIKPEASPGKTATALLSTTISLLPFSRLLAEKVGIDLLSTGQIPFETLIRMPKVGSIAVSCHIGIKEL